jgi:hypothetical protein
MKELLVRFKRFIKTVGQQTWGPKIHQFSLVAFLGVSILLSLILVLISGLLYVNSKDYKLDITRPGLKGIQSSQLVQINQQQTYDTTSPVTSTSLSNQKQSMQSQLTSIEHYSNINDQGLDNIVSRLLTDCANPDNSAQTAAVCSASEY